MLHRYDFTTCSRHFIATEGEATGVIYTRELELFDYLENNSKA